MPDQHIPRSECVYFLYIKDFSAAPYVDRAGRSSIAHSPPGCEEGRMNPVMERRLGDRRAGGRRSTDAGRAPHGMRTFTLRREEDVSGVSGTGIVLEGTLFSTGVVVVHWLTPP